MAKHSLHIKGTADFSAVAKEVDGLSKLISDSFGKEGAKVLDQKSVNFLKRETQSAFDKMQRQLTKLKQEARELARAFEDAANDEKKQEEISRKRLDNIKRLLTAEKEISTLKRSENRLNNGMPDNVLPFRRDGVMGQAARQIGNVAEDLPGVSQAMTVGRGALGAGQAASAAGLSGGAIVGLGVLGAAAAAAGVSIMRMVAGFEVFKQAIPNLLTLSGQGMNPITDGATIGSAARLGYGQLESLELQKQLGGAFGNVGAKGGQNRLLNVMTASRDLGVDANQIASGGSQLRALGGTETAQKQMAMILEKAITSGMDKTQSSSYLAAAVTLLSELNQSGVSNTLSLLGVMSSLVAKGNMSPEMAARSLGGLSGAISGSGGEANSFFQVAAARAGLGGGSLTGTQFAVRQGLMGVDMGALSNQIGDTGSGQMGLQAIREMGLGDSGFSQKFAQSIMGEMSSRFDTSNAEGRQGALGFVGQMFGAKSAPEAAKALALLEKISKGAGMNDEDKAMLSDLTKDPETSWRDKTLEKLDKTALSTAQMAARLEKGQFELGKSSAEYINKLNSSLLKLDETINKILNPGATLKEAYGGDSIMESIGNMIMGKNGDTGKSTSFFGGQGVSAYNMAKGGIFEPAGVAKPATSAAANPNVTTPPAEPAEMVNEQKKTNQLLEKLVRPGAAPNTGRGTTRK